MNTDKNSSLFVYGTLMPGQRQDQLLKPWVSNPRAAAVEGWLFALPAGYPALVLPDESGTWPGSTPAPPWSPRRVPGVLLDVEGGEQIWEQIDAYEDCRPAEPETSLYLRELRPVAVAGAHNHAWVYTWNPRRLSELLTIGRAIAGGWSEWVRRQHRSER